MRSPRMIARRYMASFWFYLDIIAAFPLNPLMRILESSLRRDKEEDEDFDPTYINQLARLVRILKVLRLIRLVRLIKLAEVLKRLQDSGGLQISAPMMRLFKMFAGFLLLWHWVGCVWCAP